MKKDDSFIIHDVANIIVDALNDEKERIMRLCSIKLLHDEKEIFERLRGQKLVIFTYKKQSKGEKGKL